METFEGSGGWEGPAWSALTLIFDWSHSSVSIPIDVSKGLIIFLDLADLDVWGDLEGQVCLGKFFLGESRELVETHLVGIFFVGIVSLYVGKILEEYFLPVDIFELRGVRDDMLGFPELELWRSGSFFGDIDNTG